MIMISLCPQDINSYPPEEDQAKHIKRIIRTISIERIAPKQRNLHSFSNDSRTLTSKSALYLSIYLFSFDLAQRRV